MFCWDCNDNISHNDSDLCDENHNITSNVNRKRNDNTVRTLGMQGCIGQSGNLEQDRRRKENGSKT
eukprot:6035623-Amphidinium_carterae.1